MSNEATTEPAEKKDSAAALKDLEEAIESDESACRKEIQAALKKYDCRPDPRVLMKAGNYNIDICLAEQMKGPIILKVRSNKRRG